MSKTISSNSDGTVNIKSWLLIVMFSIMIITSVFGFVGRMSSVIKNAEKVPKIEERVDKTSERLARIEAKVDIILKRIK